MFPTFWILPQSGVGPSLGLGICARHALACALASRSQKLADLKEETAALKNHILSRKLGIQGWLPPDF